MNIPKCAEYNKEEAKLRKKVLDESIKRFRITFTTNHKWQEWAHDHAYPIFSTRCFQFLSKIE